MHMTALCCRVVPRHTNSKHGRKSHQCLSLIQGGAKRSRDDFERKITSNSESAEPAAPLPGMLLMRAVPMSFSPAQELSSFLGCGAPSASPVKVTHPHMSSSMSTQSQYLPRHASRRWLQEHES